MNELANIGPEAYSGEMKRFLPFALLISLIGCSQQPDLQPDLDAAYKRGHELLQQLKQATNELAVAETRIRVESAKSQIGRFQLLLNPSDLNTPSLIKIDSVTGATWQYLSASVNPTDSTRSLSPLTAQGWGIIQDFTTNLHYIQRIPGYHTPETEAEIAQELGFVPDPIQDEFDKLPSATNHNSRPLRK